MPRLLTQISPNDPPLEPFVAYDLQVVYPDIDIEIIPGPPKIGGVIRSVHYNIEYNNETDEIKREKMRRPINIKKKSEIFTYKLARPTGIPPTDHLSVKNSFYLAGQVDLWLAPEIGEQVTTTTTTTTYGRYRVSYGNTYVLFWDSNNGSSVNYLYSSFVSLYDTSVTTGYPVTYYIDTGIYLNGNTSNVNNFVNNIKNTNLFTITDSVNSVNNNDSSNEFILSYSASGFHIAIKFQLSSVDYLLFFIIDSYGTIYGRLYTKLDINFNTPTNLDDVYTNIRDWFYNKFTNLMNININIISSTYGLSTSKAISSFYHVFTDSDRALILIHSHFVRDGSYQGTFFNQIGDNILNQRLFLTNSYISFTKTTLYTELNGSYGTSLWHIDSTTNYSSFCYSPPSTSSHFMYCYNILNNSCCSFGQFFSTLHTFNVFINPFIYNRINVQNGSYFSCINSYPNDFVSLNPLDYFYFYPDHEHFGSNIKTLYREYTNNSILNSLPSYMFSSTCFVTYPMPETTTVTTTTTNFSPLSFLQALETLDMVDVIIDNGYTSTSTDFKIHAQPIASWAINMDGEKVPALAAINTPFRTSVNFTYSSAGILPSLRVFLVANYFKWGGLGYDTLLPVTSLYAVLITRNFYNLDEFKPVYNQPLIPIGPIDKVYTEAERELLLEKSINSLKIYNNRFVLNNNLTTDTETIFKEENIVRLANAIARNLKIILKQFIGRVNVDPTRKEVVDKINEMLRKTILINRYVPDRFLIICDKTNNEDYSNYLYVDIAIYVPLSAKYVYIVTMAMPI